jgi:hypothetical protein
MRLSRSRRHCGTRVIPFEVRDTEIESPINVGLLAPTDRDNRPAIARALGVLLDKIPDSWWPLAVRR